MNNFWEWLTQIVNAIGDFLNWYIKDTPLLEDTLDSLYNVTVYTVQQTIPLIGEYIQYISEYIRGRGI